MEEIHEEFGMQQFDSQYFEPDYDPNEYLDECDEFCTCIYCIPGA